MFDGTSCFLSLPCSSDVDSDRATETRRKKKKKRRRRDSDSEQRSPGAARGHNNRSSEERESRKRRHSVTKDSKHDGSSPPEKRHRMDYAAGSRDQFLPPHHNPTSSDSTHAHLNGPTGSVIVIDDSSKRSRNWL